MDGWSLNLYSWMLSPKTEELPKHCQLWYSYLHVPFYFTWTGLFVQLHGRKSRLGIFRRLAVSLLSFLTLIYWIIQTYSPRVEHCSSLNLCCVELMEHAQDLSYQVQESDSSISSFPIFIRLHVLVIALSILFHTQTLFFSLALTCGNCI